MTKGLLPVIAGMAVFSILPATTLTGSGAITSLSSEPLDGRESAQAATASGFPDDVVVCDRLTCPSRVSTVIGGYGPTTVSTGSATTNYTAFLIGPFQAGTSVRFGTCGMADAASAGNTFLRLFIAGTAAEVAVNDDNCAGRGSQINYVVPHDMSLEVHAGCYTDVVGCSGTIALTARLDATPRPARVKPAFMSVFNDGVLGISPDPYTLIRGINYQGAGWGEKYHHQGIARTYNRGQYDIAWTTSVRNDEGSALNNMFFSRMGTRRSTLGQRFGSNVVEIVVSEWPRIVVPYASELDSVVFASNAGVYDGLDPSDPNDWDGVPAGRKLDHAGGIQAIGNYIVTASEFVSLPCIPNYNGCPAHGDRNIPASGQTSEVVLYDIGVPNPQPSLLISRRGQGSGWVAIAKLGTGHTPPALRNGYIVMVPDGDRLSLYAIPADPCTGYVSLSQVRPYFATPYGTAPALDPLAPPRCPGVRTRAAQAAADVSQVSDIGCVTRTSGSQSDDPYCPKLVTMYTDGGDINFPAQADVQSANFVTQANGQLYLLAFEGQQVEWGPNSEVQLWRVVFGAASGASATLRMLPNGAECQPFLCLVRAGTEDARDSFKNMYVDDINGAMFRFGGGAYIVPNANPALETFFIYGTDHYLQKTPRAARFNEF